MSYYLRHIYILHYVPSSMTQDDEGVSTDSSNSDTLEKNIQTDASDITDWGEKPLSQSTYLFIWAAASIVSFAIFVIFF